MMISSHLFFVSVYVSLYTAVSATPPDGVRGLTSCYSDGDDVSIVISSTQNDTVSLTLNEFGITYFNDDPNYTLMTLGYYNVTLLSVSPIQVNVSVIFKTELSGSTITYSEARRSEVMTTSSVSLTLCGECVYTACVCACWFIIIFVFLIKLYFFFSRV